METTTHTWRPRAFRVALAQFPGAGLSVKKMRYRLLAALGKKLTPSLTSLYADYYRDHGGGPASHYKGPKSLNRDKIAEEIAHILGVPVETLWAPEDEA